MRTMMRCAVVACVVVVLAGCLGGRPASTGRQESYADSTALELLTQSGSYHREQRKLVVAEEVLVGRCMAAKGLVYPARIPPSDQRSDTERVLRLDERRQVGYGLAGSKAPDAPADRYVKTLKPRAQAAYMRALFGDDAKRRGVDLPGGQQVTFPGDGCVYEAQSQLYGDIVTWARVTYVPEELNNRLASEVTQTDSYRRAVRDWSECMAERGYRYSRPEDAQDDLAARYKTEGASTELRQQEIAVAVADSECAGQADIPSLVLSLKKDRAGTLSRSEQQSLQYLGEIWSQAADTASRFATQAP